MARIPVVVDGGVGVPLDELVVVVVPSVSGLVASLEAFGRPEVQVVAAFGPDVVVDAALVVVAFVDIFVDAFVDAFVAAFVAAFVDAGEGAVEMLLVDKGVVMDVR